MAKNMVFKDADNLTVTLTDEATCWPKAAAGAESNDAVCVEEIIGVALVDSDADDEVTIRRKGVFKLKAHAFNNAANNSASAVVAGDALYINPATGTINKWTDGVLFGYALDDIAEGDAEIPVVLR